MFKKEAVGKYDLNIAWQKGSPKYPPVFLLFTL